MVLGARLGPGRPGASKQHKQQAAGFGVWWLTLCRPNPFVYQWHQTRISGGGLLNAGWDHNEVLMLPSPEVPSTQA